MGLFIAVDTGGTFTDLVCFDEDRNAVTFTKSLTDHDDPAIGIAACLAKVDAPLAPARLFKHGTTLVINTLLERSGPPIALVTTSGFRDVLEFARGNRTEAANLFFRRDPVLVPRERRFEVDERIDGDGRILLAPDRAGVEVVARRIEASGAAAVAVSFVNAYLDPTHEVLVAGWLAELLPGRFVTAATALTREWHEFERTATAAANAYCGPKVGGYVRALEARLRRDGFDGRFLMMGSSGGVLSGAHAADAPVMLVESGPVGGCIGAAAYARELGIADMIAFDMGGTTAKCALVRDGSFDVETTYYVGGYGKGIPVRAPVLDIVEVGAGGGSIASIDPQGRVHVGPRSAGSMPGPVAYGRGGTEPTVTDANLVLGRLDPTRFQGGEMALQVDAARAAIAERLAAPLGYDGADAVSDVASGVLALAAVTMGEAIKRVTVRRGVDPRRFVLFAYGGGGPLHAVELARELGIPTVIVPPEAGNFSAIGMLLTDIRREERRTMLRALTEDALTTVRERAEAAMRDLGTSLESDFGSLPLHLETLLDFRFVGQQHTLAVALHGDAAALDAAFRSAYRTRFGHASTEARIEIVAMHCIATASIPKPNVRSFVGDTSGADGRPVGERQVFFRERRAWLDTTIYERRALPVGFARRGPALIQEYGSTTVVGPQDDFAVGRLGEICISLGTGAAP